MRILLLLAFVAVASAALTPVTPPGTDCPRWLLSTSGDLQNPEPGMYIPNVLIYNRGAGNLMTGRPDGPYFSARAGDCFWFPNGALNCAIDLYSDSSRTNFLGTGMINSTSPITVSGLSNVPGFHLAGGDIQLRTTITNLAFVAPSPSTNFHNLNINVHFPAMAMLPMDSSSSVAPYGNGVSYIGTTPYFTVWGSNAWNGTGWDDNTRTTGWDFRATMTCVPPVTIRPSGGCPSCPGGGVVVPNACIQQRRTISQTVSGSCLSLSFSASSSLTADSGCVGGSL